MTTVLRSVRGRVALGGLAASVVLAGVLAGSPGTAHAVPNGCSSQGHYEVCLTDPGQFADGRDLTIVKRLRQLVQSANDGDHIRIALYQWKSSQQGIADDVIAAHRRGVDVRLVLDAGVKSDQPYTTMSAAGVPIHLCANSCLKTDGHIMHNKFFLFDIGGVRTVAQSSSNFTDGQMKKYQNMILISGDPKLYDFYHGYWERLEAESWQGWSNDDRHQLGSLATKGYVFPRSSGDPLLGILNNVTQCSSDGDGDGDGDKKIWVAESQMRASREKVRNRLAYMEDRMGCNVKVVVQAPYEDFAQSTTSGGYNLANDKVRNIDLHHKFVIIDAKYNGEWQEVVVTGSHNLTGYSVTHDDEAMVRVADPFVFGQYRAHYDGLFAAAKG